MPRALSLDATPLAFTYFGKFCNAVNPKLNGSRLIARSARMSLYASALYCVLAD